MEIQFMSLLPHNWVEALGMTLFHSLWIGVILAMITSVIILSTKKSTASLRYNLLTAALFLFVITIGFVFYKTLGTSSSESLTSVKVAKAPLLQGAAPAVAAAEPGLSVQAGKILNLWTAYSYQIVMIWFLIICAKGIQLMAGLHTVYYLKKTSIFDAGSHWEAKVAELSEKLGIKNTIKLLQSGLAKVPMTAGHLKPVILLPIGMLNGLSVSEVEAILSHELAHIKRQDYLVNLLQSLIEIIFFFNPAILWISKLIREERENCCDDLALSCTENKQTYIKALISCQEFQTNAPEFAMAITGRKNQLLERVSRMVFNKSTSLNRVEKMILTAVLVSTLVFTAAFTNTAKPIAQASLKTIKSSITTITNIARQDTTKKVIVLKKSSAKKAQVKSLNLQQNQDLEDAKAVREQARLAAEDARRASEEARSVQEEVRTAKEISRNTEEDIRYTKEMERYRAEMDRYSQQSSSASIKYAAASAKYARAMTDYSNQQVKYNSGEISVPPTPPAPPTPYTPPTPPTPPASPVSGGLSARDVRIYYPKTAKGHSSVKVSTRSSSNTSSGLHVTSDNSSDNSASSSQIVKSLLKDGLINQSKNLSYKLSKDGLEVNGVTQPESVHKKYMEKYLKDNPKKIIEGTVSTED